MDRSEFRLSAQAQEFIGFLVDFFIPIKWLDLRRFWNVIICLALNIEDFLSSVTAVKC